MNNFGYLTCVALLGLGLLAAPVSANDQRIVFGFGLGVHNFSSSDEVREGSPLFGGKDEIKSAAYEHMFIEWYVLDGLGIGARLLAISAGRSYSGASDQLDQTVSITSTMVTIHWVPIGANSYARFGLLGGFGPATYSFTEHYTNDASSSQDYDNTDSSSGTAQLAGCYLDWGGAVFGARFGVDYLRTFLDKLKTETGKSEVDGSGTSWYFDLRWAFK